MKNFLAKIIIDQIRIATRMVAHFQTLDIAINKPLKHNVLTESNDLIENRMEKDQRGNFMNHQIL